MDIHITRRGWDTGQQAPRRRKEKKMNTTYRTRRVGRFVERFSEDPVIPTNHPDRRKGKFVEMMMSREGLKGSWRERFTLIEAPDGLNVGDEVLVELLWRPCAHSCSSTLARYISTIQ